MKNQEDESLRTAIFNTCINMALEEALIILSELKAPASNVKSQYNIRLELENTKDQLLASQLKLAQFIDTIEAKRKSY